MKSITILLIVIGIVFVGCEAKKGSRITVNEDSPYYDVWVDYSAEELQEIFRKNEEKFDYIVQVLKTMDAAVISIMVEDPKKGNLLFYTDYPEELGFVDGERLGYVKDELFEQYINDILVGEYFSQVSYTPPFSETDFGYNFPIFYSEREFAPAENTETSGKLKDNWYYHIQQYV